MKNGKLIVIEGTDGSGKATQTRLLKKRLTEANFDVVVEDFPQYGTRSAAMVEDYLNGRYGSAEELGPYIPSVFYAVDRFDASSRIKSNLTKGKIVISNRYVSSSLAHQGGKIKSKRARERYFKWLDELEFKTLVIPRPDLTLLLHLPAQAAQQLVDKKGSRDYIKGRDIHENDLSHLKDAEKVYLELAKKFKYKVVRCTDRGELLSRQKISDLVWQKVQPVLK